MVKELKDPYSEYMTKEKQSHLMREFLVILLVSVLKCSKNNQIMVTSPMKSSPAEKAGLRPKDIVTKVNGKSVEKQRLDQVVKMVRGKRGTTVTLTIKRGSEEKDIKIKRDKIHVKSVEYKKKDKLELLP